MNFLYRIWNVQLLLLVIGCWHACASPVALQPAPIALVEKGKVSVSSVSMSLDYGDVFPAQTPETLRIKVADSEPVINVIRSLDALAKSGTVEFIFVNSDGAPYCWPRYAVPTSDNYISHPWMKCLNEVLSDKRRVTMHGFFRFVKIDANNQASAVIEDLAMRRVHKNIFILNPNSDATWDSVVDCLDKLHSTGIHAFVFARNTNQSGGVQKAIPGLRRDAGQ